MKLAARTLRHVSPNGAGDLEQHFRERTANDHPKEDKENGFWFLPDHWIEEYSGKISNMKPTAEILANPPAIELATTYMEKFARCGLESVINFKKC